MSIDSFKQALDNFINPPAKNAAANSIPKTDFVNDDLDNSFYITEMNNWYKAPPYGFRWRNRFGRETIMMLPINPSNLNITTHFATNVITTLYGTVEEHSEQRYFDIVIEGTTGMTPKYTQALAADELDKLGSKVSSGRLSYGDATDGRIGVSSDIAGGFFAKTIGVVNAALNKAQDLVSGREDQNRSGVFADNTGYVAFHRLYKFLLSYKADMVGLDPTDLSAEIDSSPRKPDPNGNANPLLFLNYKDNCRYTVAVQRFTLRKTAENPMLYYYNITLRAYNIEPLDALTTDIGNRLTSLGLDGVKSSTLLSEVKDLSNGAKQIFGAGLGGASILGK
jgi:hypothetical protein